MNFKMPCFEAISEKSQDDFGFSEGAKKLTRILKNIELPNSFGVYGVWGSGKTSLMKLTKENIDRSKEKEIATIWFDPWKYEYDKDVPIVYPLLFQIQKKFVKSSLKEFLKDSGRFLGAFSLSILPTSLSLLSMGKINKKLKDVVDDVEVASSLVYSKYENWVDNIDNFRNEFESELNLALKEKGLEKLFIFIDDMDRCMQENVIQLLEIMKNYLNVKNTLFIFGMDRRVIIDHINQKYPSGNNNYGQEYLEKIIPCSITIPANDPIRFLENILLDKSLGNKFSKEEIKIIGYYLEKFCKNNRRLMTVIFHKYLTCLTYINFEKLKKELVGDPIKTSRLKWNIDEVCRIGILRMCILQERIPTFFDKYSWADEYERIWSLSINKIDHNDNASEIIRNISSGYIDDDNINNELVIQIVSYDAIKIIFHINNDLFITE